jgi:hypothetical protein
MELRWSSEKINILNLSAEKKVDDMFGKTIF